MRRWLLGVVGVAIAILAVGCAVGGAHDQPRPTPSTKARAEPDDWVIVRFEARDRFDTAVMNALLNTEMAADAALQDAGAGWIDGNEVGGHSYDLYFVGADRNAMWAILRPIIDQAPASWSSVELRHGLDDAKPTVFKHP